MAETPRFKWTRHLAVALAATALLGGCGLLLDEQALLERAREARARGDNRAALIDLKNLLEKHPDNAQARLELGEVALAFGDVQAAIRELELARDRGIPPQRVAGPLALAYLAAKRAPDVVRLLESVPQTSADPGLLALKGNALMQMQRASEARNIFEAALSLDPTHVEALLGLAKAVAEIDGPVPALEVAARAARAAPEDPRVPILRGALYERNRAYEEASREFEAAAKLAAQAKRREMHLTALAGLTDVQLAQGDVAAALKTTEEMHGLAPNAPMARLYRARSLFLAGRLDEARQLLEINVSQDVQSQESKLLLGAVSLAARNFGQAEMYLASVVSADPDNIIARQLLAEARLQQHKGADALQALLPVLEGEDANAELLALAGRASLAAGATASGLEYMRRSAEASPGDTNAQLDLVAAYIAAGDADRARSLLNAIQDPSVDETRIRFLTVLTHVARGDHEGAIKYAVQSATTSPNDPAAQTLAGEVLTAQGQFDRARVFFERAVKLKPDSPRTRTRLGRALMLQGRMDDAHREFSEALRLRPGEPAASLALASLELGRGQTDAALAVLEACRRAHPMFIDGRVFETQVLVRAGRLKDAEASARATLQAAPSNPAALTALGRVLAQLRKFDEAITHLNKAVEAAPNSAIARVELARAHAMAGRNEQANLAALQALAQDKDNTMALALLTQLALARNDVSKANQYVSDLSRLAPERAGTHVLLGDVRMAQRDYAGAAAEYAKASSIRPTAETAAREFEARRRAGLPQPLERLRQYVATRPDDLRGHFLYAQSLTAVGQPAEAVRTYEQILLKEPRNAVALNNLAWLRFEMKDPRALSLARQAYEIAPGDPRVVDTYAWILVSGGKVAEGLALLEPIAGSAADPQIRMHYAHALARAGRKDRARRVAEALVRESSPAVAAEARQLIVALGQG